MTDLDYQQLHEDLIEQLMSNIPECWGSSEGAAESILVDYVREIERRLIERGGSLEHWPEDDSGDTPLVSGISVIDAAEPYLREMFGGPEHSYRLHVATPTGGVLSFHDGATADDVVTYWRREGWLS